MVDVFYMICRLQAYEQPAVILDMSVIYFPVTQ